MHDDVFEGRRRLGARAELQRHLGEGQPRVRVGRRCFDDAAQRIDREDARVCALAGHPCERRAETGDGGLRLRTRERATERREQAIGLTDLSVHCDEHRRGDERVGIRFERALEESGRSVEPHRARAHRVGSSDDRAGCLSEELGHLRPGREVRECDEPGHRGLGVLGERPQPREASRGDDRSRVDPKREAKRVETRAACVERRIAPGRRDIGQRE
ncbi:MAG: hypothetical protein U0235_11405 [Polyangiaceae bacterium]